jgi:murein DD-endopeptidase MepM/ murein hydrolase activator NlpD
MIRALGWSIALLAATIGPWDADYRILSTHHLTMPVKGANPAEIQDSFRDARSGGRSHEATDILAPRNTPVVAMDDGVIRKLFTSVRGGLTIYQFDPSEAYCYYYAHLDRYAAGIKENLPVHRGDVIGYVGTTGDAPPDTPHLHLEIMRLGPEKKWWQATDINPYPLLKQMGK